MRLFTSVLNVFVGLVFYSLTFFQLGAVFFFAYFALYLLFTQFIFEVNLFVKIFVAHSAVVADIGFPTIRGPVGY